MDLLKPSLVGTGHLHQYWFCNIKKWRPIMACFTSRVIVASTDKVHDKLSDMVDGTVFGIEPFLMAKCMWEIDLTVREPHKSYLSVGLTMVKKQTGTKQVMFDVCAVDKNGHKHYHVKDRSSVFMIKPGDTLWKPFLPMTDGTSLLSNNNLKIRCKIHVLINAPGTNKKHELPYQPILPPKLGSDLKAVFENGSLSDVSLVVGDRTIPAHRVVLASRSSVFRAMFEHNMKESEEGRVDISDCSYEAVDAMLKFMYCDVPPEFVDLSPNDVLTVADKYDVPGLKSVCENEILRKLDVNNAARTLQLADCHNAPFLKHSTLAFISVNLRKVMATEQWREITRSQPDLMQVVLNSAAQYMEAFGRTKC